MTTPIRRPGPCAHPQVSDEQIRRWTTSPHLAWIDEPRCPDCHEYLYPHDDETEIVVYTDEPYGAGR